MGDTAKDWLRDSGTPEYQLRGAIIRHIRQSKKVFRKFQQGKRGNLIPDEVLANVTITKGHDIYIEIVLEPDDMITIYAH